MCYIIRVPTKENIDDQSITLQYKKISKMFYDFEEKVGINEWTKM